MVPTAIILACIRSLLTLPYTDFRPLQQLNLGFIQPADSPRITRGTSSAATSTTNTHILFAAGSRPRGMTTDNIISVDFPMSRIGGVSSTGHSTFMEGKDDEEI